MTETTPGREALITTVTLALDPFFDVPSAVRVADALIEASGGLDHIVRADEFDWTIQHPITERFDGSLFTCPFVRLVATAATQGAFGVGDHRVWLDRGALMWEEAS